MQKVLALEHFAAREVIFNAGDPGTCAYVIEEGCVEILRGTGNQARRVAVLAKGAMFGEVALLDHKDRTATVRTLIPTRLVRIDRDNVTHLVGQADPVVRYLLDLLLARFRHAVGPPDRDAPDSPSPSAPEATGTFPADARAGALRTLTLIGDLATAVDNDQLELFYQPLLDLQSPAPVGFEALIRWRHPVLGMVNPAEFIPLAERTGLVHRIGRWTLGQALADWPELRSVCRTGPNSPAFVSINLSAPELASDIIVDRIRHDLDLNACEPGELQVELTESTIIGNMAGVSRSLQSLRKLGVRIALDDFGTGYAGLDYLQSLPFSCIKIDKSFVSQMGESERSFHIINSALELASALRMTTVAEGIENGETAGKLREMGCCYAQGYYYGRPMDRREVRNWADAKRGDTTAPHC